MTISGQVNRTAAAESTAHQINGIGTELAHAAECMKAARRADSDPDLRHHHTTRFGSHLMSAMGQAEQLKDNMLANYPAEAAEWKSLNQVMDLAGYSLNKRSGMISLDIPPGTIPTTPNGVEDHHITVVYLGSDVDDEAYAEACRRAQEAASAMPGPLSGTVGGVGTFPPTDDGQVPAWAGVVLPGAERIRSSLESLSASQHKDWKPHVTLAMLDPGEPLPDPVPPTQVTFTHLTVHRGEDVMRYPLGGGPVEMSKAVNPAAKAASFAHLLQTIKYDGAHACRHADAMIDDTDDAAWNFDADHAEKHMNGAHEHARKLAGHIADNYPQEAGFLKELTKKEDLSMENISGQALALSFDSSVHPRDAHGRFVHVGGTYSAASVGRPRAVSAPRTTSAHAPGAAHHPAPPHTPGRQSQVKVAAAVYTQQRVYTDKEVGKALDEIKKLRDEVQGQKHTEPRARLAVRIGFLAVGVVIAALTAGAALPITAALAIPILQGTAGELAEFHIVGREKGARFLAHPIQTLNPRRPMPAQLSNEPGDVTDQAAEVLATALQKDGLSPNVAQRTAAAMVDHWMQTEGWRLQPAAAPGSNITDQINTIQFANAPEPPPFPNGESISGQVVELGKFQDAWMHEMRGKHGEWTRSPGSLSGSPEPAYKVPPHERLINPRSRQYPDPSDHPFFKAHPMKAEHVLHAYSMATPGQKEQGMRWYADAGLVAGAIAHGDQHKGAGLLSAYSPQTSWPINMFNAARSVELGRPLGPHEGATVMQSHANAAKKIMDGKPFNEALPAPKTNAFARLIEQKGEDSPSDPYGEVVIDRHALSVAAGQRLSDKEPTPIGEDRFYQVVADEYRKAAVEASKREGKTISPSQMQAITWLVQQSANEAEDAATKMSGSAKGRVTRTANAWKNWIAYAQKNNIQTASGTTALSMLYDDDDAVELASWEHQMRDAHGRWVRDTLEKHTSNGSLTPERAALHRQIVDNILAGHQPSDHPVATFFGGGSASGKSSLQPSAPDSAKIDADAIKGELPEYRDMLAQGDPRAAALTHEESSLIAKKAVAEAQRRRINYVLDGTGDTSFAKMAAKVAGARKAGYGVHARYVTVDTDEAVRRAQKRAARTGRMVPETTIRAIHSSVSDTLAEALDKKLFDSVQLLDNNGASAKSILVHDSSGHHVLDQAAYDRFLAKGASNGYAARLRGAGHTTATGLAGGEDVSAPWHTGHTAGATALGQPEGGYPLHDGSRYQPGRTLGSQRGLTAQYLDLAPQQRAHGGS